MALVLSGALLSFPGPRLGAVCVLCVKLVVSAGCPNPPGVRGGDLALSSLQRAREVPIQMHSRPHAVAFEATPPLPRPPALWTMCVAQSGGDGSGPHGLSCQPCPRVSPASRQHPALWTNPRLNQGRNGKKF